MIRRRRLRSSEGIDKDVIISTVVGVGRGYGALATSFGNRILGLIIRLADCSSRLWVRAAVLTLE
jgi:hypothetical protein